MAKNDKAPAAPEKTEAPTGNAQTLPAPAPENKPLMVGGVDASLLIGDEGAGTENMGMQDTAIPFLQILQTTSPQTVKRGEEYVAGAEPGMFFNTATGQLYDGEQGIVVIPAVYQRRYVEWKPRDAGGGLVQDYGQNSAEFDRTHANEKGRRLTNRGTEIIESAVFFCKLLTSGGAEDVVISMSSTQRKKAKRWNANIKAYLVDRPDGKKDAAGVVVKFNPAMFYRSYKLTTIPESNDQGNWFGWNIVGDEDVLKLPNGGEIYLATRAWREQIIKGEVKVAPPAPADLPGGGGDGGDDIPF